MTERFTHCPVLIVGAGPAGLAVAACLRKKSQDFQIIEQSNQVGWRWHHHYDRLHLHTARDYSALPHMGFARGVPRYPSREQVVEYLQTYAQHFAIEPQFNTELKSLHRETDHWRVVTSKQDIQAKQVVLCTGYNGSPNGPILRRQQSTSRFIAGIIVTPSQLLGRAIWLLSLIHI